MKFQKTSIHFLSHYAASVSVLVVLFCEISTKPAHDSEGQVVNSSLFVSTTDTESVFTQNLGPTSQDCRKNSCSKVSLTDSLQIRSKTTTTSAQKHENISNRNQRQLQQKTTLATPDVTTSDNEVLARKNKVEEGFINMGSTIPQNINMTTVTSGRGSDEDSDDAEVRLDFPSCFNEDFQPVLGRKGTVVGMFGRAVFSAVGSVFCTFSIHISKGFQFLYLLFSLHEDPCNRAYWFYVSLSSTSKGRKYTIFCKTRFYQLFVEGTAYITLMYRHLKDTDFGISNSVIGYPKFRIDFESYNEDIRKYLVVTHETSNSGNIATWGYDGMLNYLCISNASYKLTLQENHVVMLSFARFDISTYTYDAPQAGLWVYSLHAQTGRTLIFYKGNYAVIPANVYFTSLLVHFKTQKHCGNYGTGFTIFFSFHLTSETPQKSEDGQFNCSTPGYSTYKKHLECNLEPECKGEEDEGGHCPYSSPECRGMVSSGTKCYAYIKGGKPLSFHAAQAECLKRSGDLAMMKTQSEWMDLNKIFQYGKRFLSTWIGVKSMGSNLPDIYKYTMKWVDDSIAQNVHVLSIYQLKGSYFRSYDICGVLRYSQKMYIVFETCKNDHYVQFLLCQKIVDRDPLTSVTFPVITFLKSRDRETNQSLILCPQGHVTHAFLSCDFKSHCGIDRLYVPECKIPKGSGYFTLTTFVCDDGTMTLPYSLVCDFRHDCNDSSDETFCIHERICEGFRCDNGQCIEKGKRCDRERDCLDESDEVFCKNEGKPLPEEVIFPLILKLPPPVKIDFDYNMRMLQHSLKENEPCPNSHFQCTEPYCLPVYLYCNGVRDCPEGEDEVDCNLHQCPGYYRCRFSSVCVHVDHLCDGLPQCPQHDDEWLCNTACPHGCLCQGHALRCFKPFSTRAFPQVRYLDATGSDMQTGDINGFRYIVYLSLAQCNIQEVSKMTLFNLKTLNLNHNKLTSLNMYVLGTLRNLKTLHLSGNPLVHFCSGKANTIQGHLRSLDLSWTSLATFSSDMISCFANLTHLDISYSQIHTIQDTGFSKTPHLKLINLRGNPIHTYPHDIFKQLGWLQSILTDDFRFCCHQSLPESFPADGTCTSYTQYLSSCDNLIPYREHRFLLFVVMIFAVAGNIVCLVLKLCLKKNALSSTMDFLMTNVNVIDLLMGLYTLVIMTADWIYRQNYFSVRYLWTTSLVCKTAGFVASVSYHASAFMLFFIGIQGFLFTYSYNFTAKIQQRSVRGASVILWTLAIIFSLVPLLATLKGWTVHGHSDTCIVLLSSTNRGPGFDYVVVTTVVLHLLLSAFACVGQFLVLWVKYFHDDLSLSIAERSQKMAEARRAFPIIFLDCARRCTFCVVELSRVAGLAKPDRIQVLYNFFILPTTSAVNPLLYGVSVLLERRRQATEERLLQRLVLKLALQKNV